MSVLPRAATSQELTKLRAIQQRTQIYLTAPLPTVVYQAQLSVVPPSTDKVVTITYASGTGTYTNIVPDQTLWVGSTPGTFDLGTTRIRNLTGLGATSGTMNIGQTSEVNWQPNCYLTVIDEFQIWRRDPQVLTDGTIYMDWDIVYTNQHTKCASVPILGPPAVKWLTESSVTVAFDASNSWTVNNTITAYAWVAPGAVSTTGLTTATPTMTYNAPGQYRVTCTITNSDGVSYTGYRHVFILNKTSTAPLLITQFELDSLMGDFNTGSWSAQVTLPAEADLSLIRDRQMIILHARDWYGPRLGDEGSVSYAADRENILLVGWVALEQDMMGMTGKWNTTTFTIQGPGWMLGKPTAYPVTLKDKNIAPVKWTRFQGVTARAMMWHIFMWRTTCMRFMDVYPMNNSWGAARLDAAGGLSLWDQINTILKNHYNASACSDRYGRVHIQQQQNLLDSATRNTIPTVMTLTRNDWANNINFDRRQIDDVGYINFSGVAWNGSAPTALFSLAPGHTPTQYGLPENPERLVLNNDQSAVNTYAAAYRGWRNNPYPRFPFSMPMNNRMIDIAPYQYIVNNFVSTDTPRGFVDTNRRFIPRTIRMNFNKSFGFFTTDVDCEAETPIGLAVTGDTPALPPPISTVPPPPPPPPPAPVPFIVSNVVGFACYVTGQFGGITALVYSGYSSGGQPTWTTLAFPANWSGIEPVAGVYDTAVFVPPDGTRFILVGKGTDNHTRIWECTNWNSIRNNPTPPAPTWVDRVIWDVTNIGGVVVHGVATLTEGNGEFDPNDNFRFNYTGSSQYWIGSVAPDGTLSSLSITSANNGLGMGVNCVNDVNLTAGTSYERDLTGAILFTFGNTVFGKTDSGSPYRNILNGPVVCPTYVVTGGNNWYTLRTSGGHYDLLISPGNGQIILGGTPKSTVVHATTSHGPQAWKSSDGGVTFAPWASWHYGRLVGARADSDQGSIWASYDTITSGNVPVRLYDASGNVVLDLTGNWWTGPFSTQSQSTIFSFRAWYQS